MTIEQRPALQFWKRRQLPVVLQTEAAECAVACLAMIASYWGHRIDMANLRRRFSVSLKGTTLKSLVSMAQSLALQTRPLKLGLERLKDLKLPCVLHWDMNHFVVLKRVSRGHIVVHDPASGERRVSLENASTYFTGIALELAPGPSFQHTVETRRISLPLLTGRVAGLKRGLLQLLLLGGALEICALIAPFYLQWTVDEALVSADRDLLSVLGLGFLLLVLIQTGISSVRSWVTTALATDLNFQWLGNTFAHLMRLPLPYFEKRHLGDIVSRVSSIQTIQKALTSQFVEGVIDGLLVIGTLVLMLAYSATLTAVACAAVALYALLRLSVFRGLRNANAEQIVHAAKQQTLLLESVRGAQTVRLFGRGEERRICWMNVLADQFNAELQIARLSLSYQTGKSLLFSVERVAVVWLAALAVLEAHFSVGMLFAFLSYKDQFSRRVAALIDSYFDLRMLKLHGERIADIVMSEAETECEEAEIDTEAITPSIELRNVTFRYSDAEPFVLESLNLMIAAGECLAITGASGCGKTTLVKLLLGLVEPTEGEILVGGVNIRHLGLANHRRMIGTVMQDDQLFSGSIADNISFFDSLPNQESIESCARLAAVDEEIAAMPMGYSTLMGDIGIGLSGGQKQRILLARALYKRPRILVLDEATSHLDIGNEHAVNAAIRQIPMTRVLVAHRPETIATAQRVVVLEQGRVARDLAQPPLLAGR